MLTTARPSTGIAGLRRFLRAKPEEICEFCGVPIPIQHRHVVEPATRRILCACFVCGEAVAGRPDRRYVLAPDRAVALDGFMMTDAEWHSLGLPIEMAFLFHSTRNAQVVALYPGPLGVAESAVAPEAWAGLAERNPVLSELQPDVEALLVNRLRGRRAYYRAPIDQCFALVGVLRTHWQGWSGGDEIWREIDSFMDGLAA